MKKITLLLLLPLLIACEKEDEMEVIKDCTGTYLRKNNKDFKVCNKEVLDEFDENVTVTVTYIKLEDCNEEGFLCELYHEYEGFIEVKEIE